MLQLQVVGTEARVYNRHMDCIKAGPDAFILFGNFGTVIMVEINGDCLQVTGIRPSKRIRTQREWLLILKGSAEVVEAILETEST